MCCAAVPLPILSLTPASSPVRRAWRPTRFSHPRMSDVPLIHPANTELPALDPGALSRLERFGGKKLLLEMIATVSGRSARARRGRARGSRVGRHRGHRAGAPLAEVELGPARRRSARAAQRAGGDAHPGRHPRGGGGDRSAAERRAGSGAGVAHGGARGSIRVTTLAVVEDNADNRLLLQAILDGRYTVVEYDNGVDALIGLSASLPELVLLDISLPGMDGNEILARIRADRAAAPSSCDRAHSARDGWRSGEVSGCGLQRLRHQAHRRRGGAARRDREMARAPTDGELNRS